MVMIIVVVHIHAGLWCVTECDGDRQREHKFILTTDKFSISVCYGLRPLQCWQCKSCKDNEAIDGWNGIHGR